MINLDIAIQLGFIGLMSFGSVGAVTFFTKNYNKGQGLDSGLKFILLIIFAFAYGFVPADLGSEILNRLKDAIAVATALTATYTGIKAIGK